MISIGQSNQAQTNTQLKFKPKTEEKFTIMPCFGALILVLCIALADACSCSATETHSMKLSTHCS